MDDSGILSFSQPRVVRERVEARPSATLELAYAYHRLVRRAERDSRSGKSDDKPFEGIVRDFEREHPDLIADIQTIGGAEAPSRFEFELFVLAIELGYVDDASPGRFLRDLPSLPSRFEEHDSATTGAAGPGASGADERSAHRKVCAGISRLGADDTADRVANVLRRVWSGLEPAWLEEGRAAVEAACGKFTAAFADKGDVLAALPAHHVAQFEASAEKIRAAQARDRVVVIPLYFASQGGFIFGLQDTHYVGYGIHVEQAFAHTETRVRAIAGKMKAYADPTRLMLLTLLANYGRFTPTVGDLAAQLGVSQPTVSGHLRLLREAGLVRLEKDGTKSFYHLQPDAATEPLQELNELLAQASR